MVEYVCIFTETVMKKPKTFYGKSKVSKTNETALQAVKRAKAMDTIKQTKIGRYYYYYLFVSFLTFCYCYIFSLVPEIVIYT